MEEVEREAALLNGFDLEGLEFLVEHL